MKIVFNPDADELEDGCKSSVAYDSDIFASALVHMFGLRPNEKMVRIDISEDKLSVTFERLPKDQ